MKRKYYLRGLGIGMAVTALLMGIAAPEGEKLSDDQIRQMARELGMVDGSALTLSERQSLYGTQETLQNPGAEETVQSGAEETASGEETDRPDTEETASGEETGRSDTEEDVSAEEIVILSGDSSVTVSRKLAELGLVQDAAAYDRYLCDNGYAKGIIAGTYAISPGKSEEEIARIITGKE